MSEATIRADIYSTIRVIPDIGIAHDYDRFTADWIKFKERYSSDVDGYTVVRAWDIGYEGMTPGIPMQFDPGHTRRHTFVIRGYLGLFDEDGSEKIASKLAETVCNALDNSTELKDKTKYYKSPERLASIRAFMTLVFGDLLCHYIEIETNVTEFIT